MSPLSPNTPRASATRRVQGFTRLGARRSGDTIADARLHLESAKSLVAAARHRIDKYLACMETVSPLAVNVAHVIDAADLLDAAEEALNGGRR